MAVYFKVSVSSSFVVQELMQHLCRSELLSALEVVEIGISIVVGCIVGNPAALNAPGFFVRNTRKCRPANDLAAITRRVTR